jgi:CxxC motif-containing protein
MEVVCIVCPNGCLLQAEQTPEGIKVSGNKCKRGAAFAIEELTAPKRSLTTTVATCFKDMPVVPVRTDGEIPKEKIFELMSFLKTLRAERRYKMGEILASDILGTGVNIIVTCDM